MTTIRDTTTVDLNKVSYVVFYYRNNKGSTRLHEPKTLTVEGQVITHEYAGYNVSYPQETMIERARRLEIIDTWMPVIRLQLSNSHKLEFTGEKALKLRKLWLNKLYKNNYAANTTAKGRDNNIRKDSRKKRTNKMAQGELGI